MAGIFLLLTAAATVVMVLTRVSADADQPTLAESILAIANNRAIYGLSGSARMLSGITLMVAAWYLQRTWILRERLGTPIVPILFLASGTFTAVSGALAITLAATVPNVPNYDGPNYVFVYPVDFWTGRIAIFRWITGKVGFTLMGLALIVAARYQWKAGGTLRYVAVASAIIGMAMQFIWLDAATVMHRISGIGIFIWLVVIGIMLLTGRIERQFAKMSGSTQVGR